MAQRTGGWQNHNNDKSDERSFCLVYRKDFHKTWADQSDV
jgi:hypothetical protein